jgi:putative hemolysin
MDNYLGYRVVALAVLTGLNAFFSAAEVALLSVRPEKMQALARRGNRGAQAAVSLITNMERMLSLCQAGITLASLGMGWAGEQAIHDQITRTLSPLLPAHLDWLVHGISFAFAFLFLTLVIVVIGEVVPKNLAVEKAERMAIVTAPALLFFYRLIRFHH